MAPLTKTLFLGIDAGDKFLLRSWAADGSLPVIRSLLDKGLVGETVSLRGFFEGSTWPSFYTGLTPAHHGFHRMIQMRPGSYEFHRCRPGEFIKSEPFWNTLSRAKKRVAVFDVPLSGVSKSIRGIQTVEWGSHDAVYGFQAHPGKLKREVLSKFGPHPVREECDVFGRQRRLSELRDLLVQGARKKAELTKYYLEKGGWDFLGQVFTEDHCIGHQCFHMHDSSHPSYDPAIVAEDGDLMRDVYMAVDSAIGRVLENVDDDTVVVVLASHRMSHIFGAQFLLPEILLRLKAMERITSTSEPVSRKTTPVGALDQVLGWGWRHTPDQIKNCLTPVRNRLRDWFDDHSAPTPLYLQHIDLKKSRCFPLHNGNSVSGVRLNLRGREPRGILEPGGEADAFCDKLIEDLLRITDYDTGLPMVKSVKRTAELYEGARLDHLPDLLIEWNDEKRVGSLGAGSPNGSRLRLTSEKIGMVEGTNTYCRTGDHRPEGLFIAFGPGIAKGRLEQTVSIMDFAPTFTSLLGVEFPDVDGKPIPEIMDAAPHLR